MLRSRGLAQEMLKRREDGKKKLRVVVLVGHVSLDPSLEAGKEGGLFVAALLLRRFRHSGLDHEIVGAPRKL